MWNLFDTLSLRPKFIIAIVLLVFLPVILMGGVSYYVFSDMIERKTSSYSRLSLQDTDSKLKYALNEISTVTDLAMTQQAIQQLLKAPPRVVTSEMAQEINGYILNHPQITSFSVYTIDPSITGDANGPPDKVRYMDGPVYWSDRSPVRLTYAQLQQQPWYAKVLELNGRPLWIGPGENSIDRSTMLVARVVKDYHSMENIGVLIASVKPELLEQVFWEASTLNEGNLLLLNREGIVVYSKNDDMLGETVQLSLLEQPSASRSDKDFAYETIEGVRSFVTSLPSFHDGWTLVSTTPLNILQEESRKIRNIALALVMFMLLTAFLFEKYFVRRLIETIVMTVKGLKDVQKGTFKEISMKRQAKDESGMLVLGFNRMSRQIRQLLHQVEAEQERKKEAELQALVAQINPHFIYNSLESINSLAVLQGNKEISRMVISLGKLLRISISEHQELIPLWMEIEHVKHYMNIQKMRFEDKFEFRLHLPDELKPYLTQKLIVQPLVENALYHGIEPMEGKGEISVSVHDGKNCIFIDIEDNGPGIAQEDLERLWMNPDPERKKYKESGVGMKNVHERLRLRFGEPYGLIVCSSPGEGMIIRLRIPKQLGADGEQSLDGRRGIG